MFNTMALYYFKKQESAKTTAALFCVEWDDLDPHLQVGIVLFKIDSGDM